MTPTRPETAPTPFESETAPLPRPEYPRPDRDRSERWLNLNGRWDFEAAGHRGPIPVPVAGEGRASGGRPARLEHGTYRRPVTAPASWAGSRIVLSFGAVHHHA